LLVKTEYKGGQFKYWSQKIKVTTGDRPITLGWREVATFRVGGVINKSYKIGYIAGGEAFIADGSRKIDGVPFSIILEDDCEFFVVSDDCPVGLELTMYSEIERQ